MQRLAELWRRAVFLLRRERFDREMSEEMRFHLEMKAEEYVEGGMTPEEALNAARRQFGNQTRLQEASREVWSFRMIETLLKDVRYAARVLLKSPGFTAVAVVTLALGIGANTAIFSVVNSVLLRPLPYPNAGRIAAIQELNEKGTRVQVTAANFLDWRRQNTVFERLAAILSRPANLAVGEEAERVNLAMTSADFFEVFGVRPQLGRLFLPEDERAGHAPVAVLSHGLWLKHFGGDPSTVGRSVTLDGQTYTIIGVAPAGFEYPDKTAVWVPPFQLVPTLGPQMDVESTRGFGFLSAVGLLKPGVSVRQADDEMAVITARLRQQYPEANNNRFDRVESLRANIVGESGTALLLLLGAVGLVLLIACANVANLMLARAASRVKEVAVRLALGATRLRLVRQLLVESVLLALVGGGAGLLLGWWGVGMLRGLLPSDFPRAQAIGVDLRVLGFTFLVSLLTGVLFGLAPALRATKTDLNESLKEGGRGGAGDGRSSRVRSLLVVSEVALSLVLLVGAGLLFRSFLRLQEVELGFRPEHILTFSIAPSGPNFTRDPQYSAFYSQVAGRVGALPGVTAVGVINTLPLSKGPTSGFQVEGQTQLPKDRWPRVNYRSVSPDYFRAVGVPVLKGRAFDAHDDPSAPPVVIVNQSLARRDFPGEDPVGKRINLGGVTSNGQPLWWEIVGVVGDVRSLELRSEAEPELYTSYLQDPFAGMSYVVRASVGPEGLIPSVREVVREVDRAQPVTDFREMEQIVNEAAAQPRFNSLLLAAFAGLSLLLAAAGIYGVMSYGVTQRTREIGLRMALGAQGRDVLRLVVGRGMGLTLLGVGLGLAASFGLTRVLRSLLFGVSETDPLTFAGVSLVLALVAFLACLVPARRAAKVDPMVALRYE
jgi:putative ABC transport system permease protein